MFLATSWSRWNVCPTNIIQFSAVKKQSHTKSARLTELGKWIPHMRVCHIGVYAM